MDGRPTWTDCDETGDYAVPNVLSPRDLVFRPDNMDETVLHIKTPHQHRSVRSHCISSDYTLTSVYYHHLLSKWFTPPFSIFQVRPHVLLTIYVSKTKKLISFEVTAQLICAFGFAYALSKFSQLTLTSVY